MSGISAGQRPRAVGRPNSPPFRLQATSTRCGAPFGARAWRSAVTTNSAGQAAPWSALGKYREDQCPCRKRGAGRSSTLPSHVARRKQGADTNHETLAHHAQRVSTNKVGGLGRRGAGLDQHSGLRHSCGFDQSETVRLSLRRVWQGWECARSSSGPFSRMSGNVSPARLPHDVPYDPHKSASSVSLSLYLSLSGESRALRSLRLFARVRWLDACTPNATTSWSKPPSRQPTVGLWLEGPLLYTPTTCATPSRSATAPSSIGVICGALCGGTSISYACMVGELAESSWRFPGGPPHLVDVSEISHCRKLQTFRLTCPK